ncbi:MAG: response regulator transcription factor [Candidatus Latescibacteria bacterium]|nr:DNA-binding response regulator [Gemmatimonadaceae bacterium]MDP6015125.1 response regulator transcription factor [Candidatus Latescibacterota bacterium]MDP7448563.1 response regulator transcription factor [Candidatus Latescibacterota bacterium]HJP34111.1 response regulator transcription factor [Candidatus Latescibacterota bacterium]
MKDTPIEVLLVDDHPVVRDGISSMLSGVPHIAVCGSATGGLEAVALAEQLRPDVVIMDIGLPDINGLEATRQLTMSQPEARVIVLTVYDNREYVLRAARVGARGYLVKNSPSAHLLEAIEGVHEGRLCYPAELTELVLEEVARGAAELSQERESTDLSTHERQVLALIAGGLSNRETADRLALSVRTIETHRRHIMDKLDIHSVAGLTKYAIQEGLTHVG